MSAAGAPTSSVTRPTSATRMAVLLHSGNSASMPAAARIIVTTSMRSRPKGGESVLASESPEKLVRGDVGRRRRHPPRQEHLRGVQSGSEAKSRPLVTLEEGRQGGMRLPTLHLLDRG